MKKLSQALLAIALLIFTCSSVLAQENNIEWLSFEEAIKRNEKEPKKIMVDVYTSWCGWCKKMDATTFKNPVIVDYIKKNYYAVKLNAERKDSVLLGNQWFVNESPKGRRSPHQLAVSLLGGKMTYPSTVFLDESVNRINPPIAGFLDAKTIEPILHFFGDNIYSQKDMTWPEFEKSFEGKVK